MKKDVMQDKWFFIVPISNLYLSRDVKNEFRIDRILLISRSKLPLIRRRIGFPCKYSEFKKNNSHIEETFFSKYETFATMQLSGHENEARNKFLSIVRDELAILSLSQLGFSRRRHNAVPTIATELVHGETQSLMINQKTKKFMQNNRLYGKFDRLYINRDWLIFNRKLFFLDLLRIITKKIKVSHEWRKDLRNASILAGQSQISNDIPQSFIWNMIAIELLLTTQGDTYVEQLPRRVEAFLEWTYQWDSEKLQEKIRDLYSKRCSFVHGGKREEIKIEHLLLSDTLLLNLLINIVKHPKIFYSKKQLINFSQKVEAEHILNLKPKIRPKTFRAAFPVYSERDREII